MNSGKQRRSKIKNAKSKQTKPCIAKPKPAEVQQGKRLEKMTASNSQGIAFQSLFDSLRDNDGAAEMPTFNATTRDEALKQMLDSVPRHDRRTAKVDVKKLEFAVKSFTGKKTCVPTPNSEWLVDGLTSTLTSYQMLGVAFMRGRETGGVEPRGGIQADAMGFGSEWMPLSLHSNTTNNSFRNCHDDW